MNKSSNSHKGEALKPLKIPRKQMDDLPIIV